MKTASLREPCLVPLGQSLKNKEWIVQIIFVRVCFVWTLKNQRWYLLSAFLTFLSVVKISCIFHPPTWNIGDSWGMRHNLWIGIRECCRSLPIWKVKPNRVFSPSNRWSGSVLFVKAAYLLGKALTKASPSPLAQFFFHSYSDDL